MSEQLIDTKDQDRLMAFFGRIPENYWKTLTSYPFIYFNDVKSVKLDYCVKTVNEQDPTFFSFDLELDIETNDHLDKRYRTIEEAVRKLFWSDSNVQIKLNGEEVYKSE